MSIWADRAPSVLQTDRDDNFVSQPILFHLCVSSRALIHISKCLLHFSHSFEMERPELNTAILGQAFTLCSETKYLWYESQYCIWFLIPAEKWVDTFSDISTNDCLDCFLNMVSERMLNVLSFIAETIHLRAKSKFRSSKLYFSFPKPTKVALVQTSDIW